ncbi:acyltransferase domain-containing protein [Luteococcus peritonei]|uniref:Acyltransferase domain-containing protein n=1 Tax=Luteococcus peritonei TaxID=88874 RepID=A0ABW4RXV3_9ACTN
MDARTALARDDLESELVELGVRSDDLGTVLGWREQVLGRPDHLARIELLVERLHALVGHRELIEQVFEPVDDQHELGRGVLPLFALVLAAPNLRAVQAGRGIPPEVTRASLADLGQQVWKDRQVNGSTGLHNHRWLCHVWADGYLKLGRLQFELTDSDVGLYPEPVKVLSVHIDESGPLEPEQVDASLERAMTFFEEHYPEAGPIDWIICSSWLLDPGLGWRLGECNITDFARRFNVWKVAPNDRDALYFGFGIEPDPGRPPLDVLADRAPEGSLQRAVVQLWRAGEQVMLASGRLPVISEQILE